MVRPKIANSSGGNGNADGEEEGRGVVFTVGLRLSGTRVLPLPVGGCLLNPIDPLTDKSPLTHHLLRTVQPQPHHWEKFSGKFVSCAVHFECCLFPGMRRLVKRITPRRAPRWRTATCTLQRAHDRARRASSRRAVAGGFFGFMLMWAGVNM